MLSLNDRNWKPYKIKDIFVTIKDNSQVPTGAYIEKKYLDSGDTPRVTVTSTNNGIDDFWSTEHKNNREFSNFISVNFLGDAFYHPYTASLDMKVHCLKLKNRELNAELATFICCALKNNTKKVITDINYQVPILLIRVYYSPLILKEILTMILWKHMQFRSERLNWRNTRIIVNEGLRS